MSADAADVGISIASGFQEMVAAGAADRAVARLRAEIEQDVWAACGVTGQIGSDGPGGLRAAMAARGLLHGAAGRRWLAVTAWLLARDDAEIDAQPADASMGKVARAAIDELGGSAIVGISGSVRHLVRLRALDVLTAVQTARLLQGTDPSSGLQSHGHLGGGMLAKVEFPPADTVGPALPVLSWLAPLVERIAGSEVLDTTLVLLGLADRDSGVAAALRRNGCDAALREELAAKGWQHREWQPSFGSARLTVTATQRLEPGEGVRAGDDSVTVATWGRRDGTNYAVVGTAGGQVELWGTASSGSPVQVLRTPGGGSVTGVVLDEQLVTWDADEISVELGGRGLVEIGESPNGVPDQLCALGRSRTDGQLVLAHRRGDLVSLPVLDMQQLTLSGPLLDGALALADSVTSSAATTPRTGLATGRVDGTPVVAVAADVGVRLISAGDLSVRTVPIGSASPCSALAAGELDGRGTLALASVNPSGPTMVAVVDLAMGDLVAALPSATEVVDANWAIVEGRSLLCLVDQVGEVQVWDLADLRPLVPASRPITSVVTARLGPGALLVRTIDGRAELRALALATVVDEVPEYRSDDVSGVRNLPPSPADDLGREAEADAIAEVITSARVKPPLAIGLFGEWGEGKSYFMQRIQYRVDRRTADTTITSDELCRHVRQISFNAWHFAEADLWASLVAHLFDQLASPADGGPVDQDGMTRLRAEVVRARQLEQRLGQARDVLAELDEQWEQRAPSLPKFDKLPAADRRELRATLGVSRAEVLYNGFVHARGASGELAGRFRGSIAALRRRPIVAGIVIALLVTTTFIGVVASRLGGWDGLVAAVAAVVPFVGAVTVVADRANQLREQTASVWRDMRDRLTVAANAANESITALRVRREVAAAEVGALEQEHQRSVAAGQLAGILEERLKDGTYRSRLGIMSRIHDDFRVMAELLAATGQARAECEGEIGRLPHVERIVLYVDDLDRCPPKRVVEVLEAIHLLLAINLFVVVVAVDPRWLLRALSTHYQELLGRPDGPGDDESDLWRSTPIHYLEKIFQVPITLAPLDATRYRQYVTGLTRTAPPTGRATRASAPIALTVVEASGGDNVATTTTEPAPAPAGGDNEAIRPIAPVRLPRPPDAQQVDPLVLSDDELEFVTLLGPPLITTPRGVKRLLNSYGLLLAMAHTEGRQQLIGPVITDDGRSIRPHRAALTLLAIVVGAYERAPALFEELHRACLATPDQGWLEFLESTGARHTTLTAILRAISRDAAQLPDGLGLPDRLRDWQPWIVPCGRLSFQTGRVVVRLAVAGTRMHDPLADSAPRQ